MAYGISPKTEGKSASSDEDEDVTEQATTSANDDVEHMEVDAGADDNVVDDEKKGDNGKGGETIEDGSEDIYKNMDVDVDLELSCERERLELRCSLDSNPSSPTRSNNSESRTSNSERKSESSRKDKEKEKRVSTPKPDKELVDKTHVEMTTIRFLPNMRIRVSDSSKVPSAGGKNGLIKKLRKNQKVTVKLDGAGLSERIVQVDELEPFIPEEGDLAKLLLPDHTEQHGKVLSLDDDDIAEIEFEKHIYRVKIDHLCKVEDM
eukprot:TRINITY_DN21140_c0_g1_i2.p1 TRINITY_DN21140_c0_g1~~TRINITY_DN21140_c0_g1_i2.p1  ORF type:complete len:292 (+),score=55.43 TRINITY_DN21140_c0_g1_i2:89-877(+)